MKFMITWEIHPSKRQDVFAAFASMNLTDYQNQPGPSIQALGRWHDVANGRGIAICETTDAAALSAWLMKWNHAVDFTFAVVHDDAEAHALVEKHVAASA